jgi:hypothetical protein
VVSAYQFFLAFPIVAIAVKCLAELNMAPVIATVLSALLVAGELNVPYMNLHRSEELARIAVKRPTDLGCEAFYVSGWRNQEKISPAGEWANNVYAHNVTAMMIAQQINLPTVNGMASFNPRDWVFGYPERLDYEARVASYSLSHGIQRLCRLDLNTKEWTRIDVKIAGDSSARQMVEIGERSGIFAVNGYTHEPWGIWFAEDGALHFKDALTAPVQITLWVKGYGPNAGRRVYAVLGDERVPFEMPRAISPVELRFSGGPAVPKVLRFEGLRAVSPQSMGESSDDRRLAFAIAKVEVRSQR